VPFGAMKMPILFRFTENLLKMEQIFKNLKRR
jgi:hypothetical protein